MVFHMKPATVEGDQFDPARFELSLDLFAKEGGYTGLPCSPCSHDPKIKYAGISIFPIFPLFAFLFGDHGESW